MSMRMVPIITVLLTISGIAVAQPQTKSAKTDNVGDICKPIGRTEDGKLIYSLNCENIPNISSEGSRQASEKRSFLGSGFFGMSSGGSADREFRGPAVPPNPN